MLKLKCGPKRALPGTREDDGILVTTVTDVRPAERDFLLFLDARNMSEVARANFDVDIACGNHGFHHRPK